MMNSWTHELTMRMNIDKSVWSDSEEGREWLDRVVLKNLALFSPEVGGLVADSDEVEVRSVVRMPVITAKGEQDG